MPDSTGTGAVTGGALLPVGTGVPENDATGAIMLAVATKAGAALGSIHTSPSILPVNDPHQQNIRLALPNAGWTGSTTFSVSGVTGCSVLHQSVSSGQFATITVSTPGVTAGTLTISDGSNGGVVKVKATSPSKMRYYNGLFIPSPIRRDEKETVA